MNPNETTIVTISASFRSRWGHHPCDYATYRKLKRLNHLIQQAKHQAAAQWRYDRKTVNQGVRFEPICRDGRRMGRRRIDCAVTRPEAPVRYTLVLLGHRRRPSIGYDWVGDLFRASKTPSPLPIAPLDPGAVAKATEVLELMEGRRTEGQGSCGPLSESLL